MTEKVCTKFEKIRYPDGQISAKALYPLDQIPDRIIRERINSYEDLFYVCSIADVIKYHKDKGWTLFIPCMFGQRSDRRFSKFQSFDLKLICDLLNNCNFDKVQILDPHSDVTLALINNSEKVSSFHYVGQAVADLISNPEKMGTKDLIMVSPDAGAYKKVFEFGEKLNVPVMGAMKHRDKDGTISISFTHDVEGKDCLIVDDLCDGGATFISLAKLLRLHKARKVYLYVTHGLFSKGFGGLRYVIDHIYCTNSIRDISGYDNGNFLVEDYITQYKVI